MKLSEKHFQAQITELATLYGWQVFSIPDSRRASCRGYPDLTLLHPGWHKLLYRELKVGSRKPTQEQADWLSGLAACGHDAAVWRPAEWDEIIAELACGAEESRHVRTKAS